MVRFVSRGLLQHPNETLWGASTDGFHYPACLRAPSCICTGRSRQLFDTLELGNPLGSTRSNARPERELNHASWPCLCESLHSCSLTSINPINSFRSALQRRCRRSDTKHLFLFFFATRSISPARRALALHTNTANRVKYFTLGYSSSRAICSSVRFAFSSHRTSVLDVIGNHEQLFVQRSGNVLDCLSLFCSASLANFSTCSRSSLPASL